MCGIVATIGFRGAAPLLLQGLQHLEYRGYDSSGLATVTSSQLHCCKAEGKLAHLREKLEKIPMAGCCGIGHTRWATHGKPDARNAHPQLDEANQVAVVQNGIIENHRLLRQRLEHQGVHFRSDTDTEVVPHLVAQALKDLGGTVPSTSLLRLAVAQAVQQLEGAYALAVVWLGQPEELVAVRYHAPLVVGLGEGQYFCASDTPALAGVASSIVSLEDGEMARLTPLGVELFDASGQRTQRTPQPLRGDSHTADKRQFRHFMLKEIHEQADVAAAWVERCLAAPAEENLTAVLRNVERVQILACGTSRHAALVGAHLLGQLAGIPSSVHYASEFRYAPPPLLPHTLTIGVTQSGETADTLAALTIEMERHHALESGATPRLLGITNRPDSSLGRLVPHILDLKAGVETGVAATKTFLGQMLAFYAIALHLADQRPGAPAQVRACRQALAQLPEQLSQVLDAMNQCCADLAHSFAETRSMIYLGRGINYPIALEGALKLKEISYIHAEGYPAGEMKHGPIALLDQHVPVVSIAMPGPVFEKVLSNAQEAKARDARLIGIGPACGDTEIFDVLLPIPPVHELVSPLLTTVPMQLLAYHVAAHRGLDVDQPRNLAKSVTVE
ncbi:MAG: glutamine--fructose-6-phosphate transaminase (isomerizing) [Synechococcus sp. SB0666_bin_14]|nr:glutamine--fructose-6-phosphate transaminase (isomerizing) [Synechococcus sp. SB0666_bin_14]MYA91024.1 glutamine--fructose-6-phosphate transaminase (isomerizing) [Synechococcus sp. SB0663_bin_10]MYG47478.1 glutamine--fructose-6-phosphate transaminase (isomerizing) [Synechococcus sp. SB0675_bin_6]MYJ58936.1 glutamine--fructose-6-phosphate transaminase (isomerizing) [Synechococcus sp. SB0672_bin_6]MYK91464.1 glutamine--fructose-6-phosphate transaminase (isomerizing) [Synechococcus sp. SB0669_b